MTRGMDLAARVAELESRGVATAPGHQHSLRPTIEDMSELVVRWKPDGARRFVNDAYCRLSGASREELIGTTFWPLITEREQANRGRQ